MEKYNLELRIQRKQVDQQDTDPVRWLMFSYQPGVIWVKKFQHTLVVVGVDPCN
jgi:hypothetical protein